VFADVRCPFTHVGLRRLVECRRERGAGPALHVRAWPLELVNGEPMDVDLVDEEVRALREQVAPDVFAGFSPSTFAATSLPALALTAAAYDRDVQTGEDVALALRWALFEDGRDIADAEVLGDIARSAGLAWEDGDVGQRVFDEWREGEQRGVLGSPHYFLGGEGWFCPTLDISRDDAGFHITENVVARDMLLERASLL
jgi:predicted DsbA family dithiol-disulfide isomerase